MVNRVTVHVADERIIDRLDAYAHDHRLSRAAAGGILLLAGLDAADVDQSAARGADQAALEAAELRAEVDRLRDAIQECRADKRLLEGLLHAEKQEKAMILERIPVPPSRFEGWWGRARRRLRGGDGE